MGRCDGYYRIENRRCDRDGRHVVEAADGEAYAVCGYHEAQLARTHVARWNGETGLRRSTPVALARPDVLAA